MQSDDNFWSGILSKIRAVVLTNKNMEKPTVKPEQIASDFRYLSTSKIMERKPIGSRVRSLHDMSTFGKVLSSQTWHRVWEKTQDGWKFVGLQFGSGLNTIE